MQTIILKVKANHNLEEDIKVNARIDDSYLRYWHSVTLHFDNGDYCDVNVVDLHTIGRRITNYRTMYAVETFKEMLKDGELQFRDRIDS